MKILFTPNTENLTKEWILPITGKSHLRATLSGISALNNINIDLIEEDFEGEAGEIHTLYNDNQKIFLLGLGVKPTTAKIIRTFRQFSHSFKRKISKKISIHLLHLNEDLLPNLIECAINGLLLGCYRIGRFKSQQSDLHPLEEKGAIVNLIIAKEDTKTAKKAAKRGKAIAETQLSIFDLVNAPSNKKRPIDLAEWAIQSGEKYAFQVEVFRKKKIEELGLDALLAVNRGSEHPPVFVVMEYKPKVKKGQLLKKIGLVGKGVTFDTGGLSIKPSTNMHLMKSDMGGAAAVFGTMEVCAKLKLPIHIIGIVPATENSVDALSIKPSDVINSYSGKTIEIIDTDAEGRLILADGLAYMTKHFNPDILIDLATLTGSAVRTFGYHAAGLFSNSDELASQIYQASEATGERVWRLPLWDLYKDDIKSDVADVRNFSGRPIAGAIAAAKFLEVFTDDHPEWAHLDIAGVAFSDVAFSSQKSATGFGIRLLIDYIKQNIKQAKEKE